MSVGASGDCHRGPRWSMEDAGDARTPPPPPLEPCACLRSFLIAVSSNMRAARGQDPREAGPRGGPGVRSGPRRLAHVGLPAPRHVTRLPRVRLKRSVDDVQGVPTEHLLCARRRDKRVPGQRGRRANPPCERSGGGETGFQFGMMESSGNGWWWWWSHKGVSRRGAPNFILKRVKKGKFHVVYISRQ